MIPLLVIIGAGAALELKRFLHKNPRDVVEAQQNEKRVKKLVESLRRELLEQQRAHVEDQILIHDLRLEQERLQGLTQSLSSSVERLQTENASLSQQLREQCEGPSGIDLADLKQQVANVLEQYLNGTMKVDDLVRDLKSVGVAVDCTSADLEGLRSDTDAAERSACMVDQWSQKAHFLMNDPERLALRLAAMAHKETLASTTGPAITFPRAKTPPKDRQGVFLIASTRSEAAEVTQVAKRADDTSVIERASIEPAQVAKQPDGCFVIGKALTEPAKRKTLQFLPKDVLMLYTLSIPLNDSGKVVMKKPQIPKMALDSTVEWKLLSESNDFYDSPTGKALTVSKRLT